MTYVIYHIKSTMQVGPTEGGFPHSLYSKDYKSFGGALRTAAKWNTKAQEDGLVGPGPYGVAEVSHYRNRVVRTVTRQNLLSGKDFQEASNTPGYCSPSSEAYWSM